MEVSNKIEELNKEYNKHSQTIFKLLNDSLKEGETFLFRKLKDDSFGLILSEERNKLVITFEPTQSEVLLNSINKAFQADDDLFIGKTNKHKIDKRFV
jgi:hypothetical protein